MGQINLGLGAHRIDRKVKLKYNKEINYFWEKEEERKMTIRK